MFDQSKFDLIFGKETLYQRGKNDRTNGLKPQSNNYEYLGGYKAQVDIETAVRENLLPTIINKLEERKGL